MHSIVYYYGYVIIVLQSWSNSKSWSFSIEKGESFSLEKDFFKSLYTFCKDIGFLIIFTAVRDDDSNTILLNETNSRFKNILLCKFRNIEKESQK